MLEKYGKTILRNSLLLSPPKKFKFYFKWQNWEKNNSLKNLSQTLILQETWPRYYLSKVFENLGSNANLIS